MLATLAQITDAHVRDEESPARVPFLDRFGGPFASTFRPQEALSTQVLAAAVRAVDRLAPDAVFVTGDLIDSAESVELDQALAVLDGGRVDPDTGRRGYAGVQARERPDPFFYRPDLDAPRHPGLLGAAERPFRSPGLRAPWYPALGNHDVLVQGETPPTAQLDAIATGTRMVVALPRGAEPDPDADPATQVDALLGASPSIDVPADPRRRHLRPAEEIARLTTRDAAPDPLRAAAGRATLDYAVDLGDRARALVLDTADRAGGSRGAPAAGAARLAARAARRARRARAARVHPQPARQHRPRRRGARRARRHPGRGRGDRRQLAPQPDRAAAGGRLLADQHVVARRPPAAGARAPAPRDRRPGTCSRRGWSTTTGAASPASSRELAYLDAQGGRPLGYAGTPADRNARLFVAR